MAPDERDAVFKALQRFGGVQPGQDAIEFGSANVNGIISDFFTVANYTGLDFRDPEPRPGAPDNNVTLVGNANDVDLPDDSFDWVVCNSMLEHDLYFWKSLSEMKRLLRVGGILIIGTPTLGFGHHGVPEDLAVNPGLPTHPEGSGIFDYYRFTRSTYYRMFFTDCEEVELVDVNTCGSPRLCGSGRLIK